MAPNQCANRSVQLTGIPLQRLGISCASLLCAGAIATAALARDQSPASLCEAASQSASAQTGVPLEVLLSISLTETGRTLKDGAGQMRPWPWAANQGGDSHWFNTRAEAETYVAGKLANGVTNVDVGCFQLNHRWHSDGFRNLSGMFDPETNALYAARLLDRLYREFGDWSLAAGAYHSRTPEYAKKYRGRFDRILAAQTDQLPEMETEEPARRAVLTPRENQFPLLRAGTPQAGPSLFTAVSTGRPLFGDPS